jgi:hypothetical protein
MGSIARFANHSCNPSCELQKWNVRGEPRICLVSTRPMQAGEEITYNYQYYDDGFDSAGAGAGGGPTTSEKDTTEAFRRQVCLCGSDNCCGTIGGRVAESAASVWREKARKIIEQAGKGTRLVPLAELQTLLSTDALSAARVDKDSTEVTTLSALAARAREWEVAASLQIPKEIYDFGGTNPTAGVRAGGAAAGASMAQSSALDEEDGEEEEEEEEDDEVVVERVQTPPYISLPDLHALIKACPPGVRQPCLSAIKQAAKRAADAEKAARDLVILLDTTAAVTATGASSSSAAGSGGSGGSLRPRVYWEDLAATIRDLSGCLPVLVAPEQAWRCMELYQQCSNWCQRWLYVFCYYCSSLFSCCDVSVSLSRSIAACLHSLTRHGTSLTIIPIPQSINQSTQSHITYYYLTDTPSCQDHPVRPQI